MLGSHKLNLLAVVAACGTLMSAAGIASAETTIKIDGSNTMYPVSEAGAESFRASRKEATKVKVGISGTGGGFTKFCRGEIDIVNASRPIEGKEMKACSKAHVEYIELPMAYDALTVVVNPENTWLKTITVKELKKMWAPAAQGKITKWSQVNPAWPDEAFKLYASGPGSGTFDYFTQAIVGKANSSRDDYISSKDNDKVLIQGVAEDKNALGFIGFASYIDNQDKVKALAIDNDTDEGIIPSVETVEDATYQPLSRPIFIYVSTKAAKRPEVKEFVTFYIKNGSALVRGVQYFPLPPRAYRANMEFFKTNRVGTVFDGFLPVGLTIDDLLKREARIYEN
ncbi:MAG: PstS family phosphate ABC transporter substrate-binding protein [Nitrosospira sp.]